MLTKAPTLNGQGFVELVNHMGSDQAIIDAARVSFGGDQQERPDWADQRLLRYLIQNHHTSPLEHVSFTFHVKAPVFVVRQWHRHRTWSYNEISARYTEMEAGYYIPKEWRAQSKSNKQASDGLISEQGDAEETYMALMKQANFAYGYLLGLGVSREMARMVMPLSNFTRFYATVDLHNLLKFIELRDHEHAQSEIREYAVAMEGLIQPIVPWTVEAWKEIRNG